MINKPYLSYMKELFKPNKIEMLENIEDNLKTYTRARDYYNKQIKLCKDLKKILLQMKESK